MSVYFDPQVVGEGKILTENETPTVLFSIWS